MTAPRFYTAEDGTKYPLSEARYDMMFKVYRSDRKKCRILDPHNCLLARGIKRHPDVIDVYIGSGRDAYVIFAATQDEPARAIHFGIRTKERRVIDTFDRDEEVQSVTIVLCKPPHSWRLDARKESNARRRKEIQEGATRTPRPDRKANRVTRLNLGRRPAAPISKTGNVSVETDAA